MRPLPVPAVAAARARRGLIAIFDLDGTLAPIVRRPERARIPAAVRRDLWRLANRPDTVVGIVSGRALDEVRRLVGEGNYWLAGIHGAELQAPGGRRRRFWTRSVNAMVRGLVRELGRRVGALPGVRLEHKGPVVSVHYREAAPADAATARQLLAALRPGGFVLLHGRRVTELRPRWLPDKGAAVRWLAAAAPRAPILYAGDDATDEDAFRALRPGDFPVVVSPAAGRRERGADSPTRARYCLPGPPAVARLIRRLTGGDVAAPIRTRGSRKRTAGSG